MADGMLKLQNVINNIMEDKGGRNAEGEMEIEKDRENRQKMARVRAGTGSRNARSPSSWSQGSAELMEIGNTVKEEPETRGKGKQREQQVVDEAQLVKGEGTHERPYVSTGSSASKSKLIHQVLGDDECPIDTMILPTHPTQSIGMPPRDGIHGMQQMKWDRVVT